MSALSYGVIRVDQENSLTSLTLQDCGHVLPGGMFRFKIRLISDLTIDIINILNNDFLLNACNYLKFYSII